MPERLKPWFERALLAALIASAAATGSARPLDSEQRQVKPPEVPTMLVPNGEPPLPAKTL